MNNTNCECESGIKNIDKSKLAAFQALCELPLGDCELSRELRLMEEELMAHIGCGDGYAVAFEILCGDAKSRLEGKEGWCPETATLVECLCDDG